MNARAFWVTPNRAGRSGSVSWSIAGVSLNVRARSVPVSQVSQNGRRTRIERVAVFLLVSQEHTGLSKAEGGMQVRSNIEQSRRALGLELGLRSVTRIPYLRSEARWPCSHFPGRSCCRRVQHDRENPVGQCRRERLVLRLRRCNAICYDSISQVQPSRRLPTILTFTRPGWSRDTELTARTSASPWERVANAAVRTAAVWRPSGIFPLGAADQCPVWGSSGV